MNYIFKGTVAKIGEVELKGAKQFQVRLLDIHNNDESDFPQICRFELLGVNTALADDLNEGDKVEVTFDLRGRRWKEDKVFNSLVIWKIAKQGDSSEQSATETSDDDVVPF